MDAALQQVPPRGTINVDHVAHFVPDRDAAARALTALGFTVTPFSPQSHRLQPDGPLVPAGTGNRCVMLKAGYLEFLTPTGDTPIAAQLRAAIDRYVGVHLVAFGTADSDRDHARLQQAGFAPLAPVALQRDIETASGMDTARFTVVRVPPGTMPEGRIQFCRHHTPELVWQDRWLHHANGAQALTGVLLCVEDARSAARRYGRYTGLEPRQSGDVWHIDTARGRLFLFTPDWCRSRLGVLPPASPWIAGYTLCTTSVAVARQCLVAGGIAVRSSADGETLIVEAPASLGGLLVFEPPGSPTFSTS